MSPRDCDWRADAKNLFSTTNASITERIAQANLALVLPDATRAAWCDSSANRAGLPARAHQRHYRRHRTRATGTAVEGVAGLPRADARSEPRPAGFRRTCQTSRLRCRTDALG